MDVFEGKTFTDEELASLLHHMLDNVMKMPAPRKVQGLGMLGAIVFSKYEEITRADPDAGIIDEQNQPTAMMHLALHVLHREAATREEKFLAIQVIEWLLELAEWEIVKEERERGANWSDIGRLLGITRGSAQERFENRETPAPPSGIAFLTDKDDE
jgi:hypothetical protein